MALPTTPERKSSTVSSGSNYGKKSDTGFAARKALEKMYGDWGV